MMTRETLQVVTRGALIGVVTLTLALTLALAGSSRLLAEQVPEEVAEQVWQHRNLGKAFYENPATQYDAVGEFEKALKLAPESARERLNYGLALLRSGKVEEAVAELEKAQKQDPSIPHTWFNLGIAYKQASKYEQAIVQLERMVTLVPDDAISHYNLGVLYKLQGDAERALQHFERASQLDPSLAGPHFQLATAYRQAKRTDEAKQAMATFRQLKKRNAGAAVPEDLEWSWYSEIHETRDPSLVRQDSSTVRVQFDSRNLDIQLDAATAGLLAAEMTGDQRPDLLYWSKSGAGVVDGSNQSQRAIEGLTQVRQLVPGDIDNDGLADLAVFTDTGVSLLRNTGSSFEPIPTELPSGRFHGLWLDYDHDYDLDLVLLGEESKLLRNQGAKGFEDRTADFPFESGAARVAVRFDVVSDTQGMDVLVVHEGLGGVLYRDRLGGNYEAVKLRSVPAGSEQVIAADLDQDGWTDLLVAGTKGTKVLLNSGKQTFRPLSVVAGAAAPVVLADFENRGVEDLIAASGRYRNRGLGALGSPSGDAVGTGPWPKTSTALASADFDGDGRVDLASVSDAGQLMWHQNRTESDHQWLEIALEGVKNLRHAPAAEVEIRAGSRFQKKIYEGTPVHFGLADRSSVDAVRITWPNGLIQNESRQPTNMRHEYKEAQRLSGSCPMIFTWDGEGFRFITDVLGVAPLGATAGDGEYFPVDHDEYIQIPGDALVARDGNYEIRITEELREIAYLDQIQLLAVDHPAEVAIYTNDKFKGPPFPEFRLYGVEQALRPVAAVDHLGNDVLAQVSALDRKYPDAFERDFSGVAEMHHLTLDFGDALPDGRGILVLSGWVDWADGSTFLGASQASDQGLVMPYLQVRDERGNWQTVIEDLGIPAGKPKTIAVDLSGLFLSASREIRIVTNLCVYWDEVLLGSDPAAPRVDLHRLDAQTAELRFRGFSRPVVHPQRKQPEVFVYADRRNFTMWNPTPGLYTRFGQVEPLLRAVDDRMVIMGSGDELRLLFDAASLPPVAPGWQRDFLLFVDGWAKDGDANTAHSQTVGPLPYHGMPQYPYEAPHEFPKGGVHATYQELYNTRPALRLIRPLAEGYRPPVSLLDQTLAAGDTAANGTAAPDTATEPH